jgi:hypothetical protein
MDSNSEFKKFNKIFVSGFYNFPLKCIKWDIYEQKENNATNNELQKIRDNFFGAWINENCGC